MNDSTIDKALKEIANRLRSNSYPEKGLNDLIELCVRYAYFMAEEEKGRLGVRSYASMSLLSHLVLNEIYSVLERTYIGDMPDQFVSRLLPVLVETITACLRGDDAYRSYVEILRICRTSKKNS